MNITKSRVLFIAQYAAPYQGNFLASLVALEFLLKTQYHCEIAYVFPSSARKQKWMNSFLKEHMVYYTCDDVKLSLKDLERINKDFRPTLVHTHFDGYDLPVKAVFVHSICVWHMHNHLGYLLNPLKAIYQFWLFWIHYGIKSKGVNIISVSDEMTAFAKKWPKFSFRKPGLIRKIPNGVDLSRVVDKKVSRPDDGIFRFLAFGGRNSDKRIDVLLKAGKELYLKRTDFQILITKGTDTEEIVRQTFKSQVPQWLVLKDQTQDVTSLFNAVDCFVSCSCHETFSYAICEASVFGLPVIQSDIAGTMWNAKNPSTRLFKVNDVVSLCKSMDDFMNSDKVDEEKKVKVTIENNKRDYSLEKWALNIIDFYKQI